MAIINNEQSNKEEYRPIFNHDGYEVSNLGNVRSVNRVISFESKGVRIDRKMKQRKLAPCNNSSGYPSVILSSNGVTVGRTVHRLQMIAFVPNPENKRTVNHIDGDKTNHSLDNMEWSTYSENMLHAYSTGLNRQKSGLESLRNRKVVMLDADFNVVREFESIAIANSVFPSVAKSAISLACSFRSGHYRAYNMIWFYKSFFDGLSPNELNDIKQNEILRNRKSNKTLVVN